MKKALTLLVISLLLGAYAYFRYFQQIGQVIPYPYRIVYERPLPTHDYEKAKVLLIGDQMGEELAKYIPSIQENLSDKLAEALPIASWATKHEGIHRSVAKLKKLKKIPPIIIYHGASEEFYEKRYNIKDHDTIMENLKTYRDENILSLIITFPFTSRFFYRPTTTYVLKDQIHPDTRKLPAADKQLQMKLNYLFYELELEDMIQFSKRNESLLILMTTPLNLEVPPKQVCTNSQTPSMDAHLAQIQKQIEAGDAKTAFSEIKKALDVIVGNARAYHVMGQAALEIGRYQLAREMYEKATAFDCKTWRATVIQNNIIRSLAKKYDLPLVDFDRLINSQLGQGSLFLNDLYPQTIYYDQVVEKLRSVIKTALNL